MDEFEGAFSGAVGRTKRLAQENVEKKEALQSVFLVWCILASNSADFLQKGCFW